MPLLPYAERPQGASQPRSLSSPCCCCGQIRFPLVSSGSTNSSSTDIDNRVQEEWQYEPAIAKRQRFQRQIPRGCGSTWEAGGQHGDRWGDRCVRSRRSPVLQRAAELRSAPAPVVYYVFDMLVLSGKDLRREPLQKRREILEEKVLPRLPEPVRYSAPLDAELAVLIQSVKAHGFEGLVGKRRRRAYEPGLRSGAWMKMRVNRGQ
jgi:ATP dependent DNA ligase-like protein